MYTTIKNILQTWNLQTSERQKLQHTYLVAVIVLVVVAGLVSLVNYQLSQQILALVFAAGALYLGNLIVWALVQSLVVLPLERQKSLAPVAKAVKRKK